MPVATRRLPLDAAVAPVRAGGDVSSVHRGVGGVSVGVVDDETRRSHGGAFDWAAGVYAASRPGYPRESAAWLAGTAAQRVLDLGAGTGAFTAVLVELGHEVTAAEPGEAMLHELSTLAPRASAVQACGERLPFTDASFDVVTVAGAFHWMDHDLAVPELARVLRPLGTLGFVYNTREEGTPLAAELTSVLTSVQPAGLEGDWGAGSVAALDGMAAMDGSELFAPLEYGESRWSQRLDRDGLVGLVASRSYVINLDAVRRSDVLAATADLFDRHAGGATTLDLPYVTQCWRAVRR